MHLVKYLAAGVLAVAGAVGFAGSAHAAPVPWSTPNGSTTDFDWVNGFSDNGLFGDPTVIGSTFVFTPNSFKATSLNGVAASVSDRLQFDLIIKNSKVLTNFTVNEIGDFQITGTGQVQAGGLLLLTNLNTGVPLASSLTTTPGSPMVGPTAGALQWSGFASVTPLPANGWTKVRVVLNNILDAASGPNSTATIEKKFASGAIEITFIIPEPASLSLVGLAGMLLIRRRK